MAQGAAQQHNATSVHTGEQEPSGPGHRTRNTTRRASTTVNRSQVAPDTTRNTTHRASTPMNRSQGGQDSAHTTQHGERAPR